MQVSEQVENVAVVGVLGQVEVVISEIAPASETLLRPVVKEGRFALSLRWLLLAVAVGAAAFGVWELGTFLGEVLAGPISTAF